MRQHGRKSQLYEREKLTGPPLGGGGGTDRYHDRISATQETILILNSHRELRCQADLVAMELSFLVVEVEPDFWEALEERGEAQAVLLMAVLVRQTGLAVEGEPGAVSELRLKIALGEVVMAEEGAEELLSFCWLLAVRAVVQVVHWRISATITLVHDLPSAGWGWWTTRWRAA